MDTALWTIEFVVRMHSSQIIFLTPPARPPQIAPSAKLSSRHIVPKFENTLKMAGTFRKRPYKAVIWQAHHQFVEACLAVSLSTRKYSILNVEDCIAIRDKCGTTVDGTQLGLEKV